MAIRKKTRIEDMSSQEKEELLTEIAKLSKKYNLNSRVILEKFIANLDLGLSLINAMSYKKEEEMLESMINALGPEYVQKVAISGLFENYSMLLKAKNVLRREIDLFLDDGELGDTIRLGNMELLLLQLRDLETPSLEEPELDDIDSYMNLKEATTLAALYKITTDGKVSLSSDQASMIYEIIGALEYERMLDSFKNGTIAVARSTASKIVEITRKKVLASKNAKILETLSDIYYYDALDYLNPSKTDNILEQPSDNGHRLVLTPKKLDNPDNLYYKK